MSLEAVRLARLGAALASQSRAEILCALLGGTAHTNGELARHLSLAPSSVSEHVGVLLDVGLVRVEAQGRHRYVRLADEKAAELLERLGIMAATVSTLCPPAIPLALRYARSCYRHLAGALGVRVYDGLMEQRVLAPDDLGSLRITEHGEELFEALGIATAPTGRPQARSCLDWSERRPHLAGSLADSLLDSFLDNGWLRREPHRPRALQLHASGRDALARLLRIEVP